MKQSMEHLVVTLNDIFQKSVPFQNLLCDESERVAFITFYLALANWIFLPYRAVQRYAQGLN
jgi:hypothetical protein